MADIFSDSGVAEIVGSLVLMVVIAVGILIASLYLLSNPVPEKIPEVHANISYNGTYIIVHHNGGDSLQRDELYLMVDGTPRYGYGISGGGDIWSVGKDLELPLTSPPSTVQVVISGAGGGSVLASTDSIVLGMPSNGSILKKLV